MDQQFSYYESRRDRTIRRSTFKGNCVRIIGLGHANRFQKRLWIEVHTGGFQP